MSTWWNRAPSYSPVTTRHSVHFAGHVIQVTVTNQASTIDEWVRGILPSHSHRRNPVIVGLDCEWKPNYSRFSINKVATLQLCAGGTCLIVQLIYMDSIPQSLRDFLNNDNFNFVGIGVEEDIRKIRCDYGLVCRLSMDIEVPCRDYLGGYSGNKRLGLKGYASALLGITMEKPMSVTMSNWDAKNLTESQVQYAAIDAYVSWMLGCKVLEYI